ncbi:hypothetical protein L1987_53850 [Smallanthus sonchifolius]|uniref:Uncharacterized protein n=1 Tax=Smallanthus sonchifolius TaxID=185202 RepID=A0ACB9EXN8_9ASTR|nr:hypothetical protein L1987_53850 [Smallanthus sonchifolius]
MVETVGNRSFSPDASKRKIESIDQQLGLTMEEGLHLGFWKVRKETDIQKAMGTMKEIGITSFDLDSSTSSTGSGLSAAATTMSELLKFCIFDLRRGQHEGEELEKGTILDLSQFHLKFVRL